MKLNEIEQTVNYYISNFAMFDALTELELTTLIDIVGHDNYLNIINKVRYKSKQTIKRATTTEKQIYYREAYKISKNYRSILNVDNVMFGINRYVVDHKIPVSIGWKCSIPVDIISHISNLRIITWAENKAKLDTVLIDSENQWISNHYLKI